MARSEDMSKGNRDRRSPFRSQDPDANAMEAVYTCPKIAQQARRVGVLGDMRKLITNVRRSAAGRRSRPALQKLGRRPLRQLLP